LSPQNFPEYCNYVSDRINKALQKKRPSELQSQQVRLSFILNSDGSLKGKPVLLGDELDADMEELIIKSVEQVTPFLPFPKDYAQPEETFMLTVYFTEGE
ncbi:MAG: hypothetical protein JW714_05680, partial [Candidatus Omnitrophica bacterium]|nr:hypothetical protein [Candidatus Omnitrophota bacterium]